MKRSIALLAAGGITTILALFVLIAVMSTMAAPTAAEQSQNAPAPASIAKPLTQLADVAPQENFNAEFEATIKEREQLLQGQIAQLQQALVELDTKSQAQIAGLEQQILGLQNQSGQVVSRIESLQSHGESLQQAIQADGTTFQTEMDKMTNAEAQMRQQIDALNTQLSSAYNQITQQQALAAAAEAARQNSGRGYDDDDHDDHDRDDDHDDDHDDDDDDDHDDHDDDDDDD